MSDLYCTNCNQLLKIKTLGAQLYPRYLACLECGELMMQDAPCKTELRSPSNEEFAAALRTCPIKLIPFLQSARIRQ